MDDIAGLEKRKDLVPASWQKHMKPAISSFCLAALKKQIHY
jgi:hypothetical protein